MTEDRATPFSTDARGSRAATDDAAGGRPVAPGGLGLAAAGLALLVGVAGCDGTAARRAAEEKRLEEARAVQEEARVQEARRAADEARSRRHTERVARARKKLRDSTRASTLCDAALDLGQSRAHEAIPDLRALLDQKLRPLSVRNCAAAALVQLGETEPALAFYLACARAGTSDARRVALGGFGEVGPDAAEVALPYLGEALGSSHFLERYTAVEALANLGPAAEPLLRNAAQDRHERVRRRAEEALAALRGEGRP